MSGGRLRIFVVGHTGMLGVAVSRFLREAGHDVRTSDTWFEGRATDPLLRDVRASDADVVVNCAGALPSTGASVRRMTLANAILPLRLSAGLENEQILIHASTDGVFDGVKGPYSPNQRPDARDSYGLTKRVGELATQLGKSVAIRTSIVGTRGGLLKWLLAQQGEVNGYVDQLWNGVTVLEWARTCLEIVEAPFHSASVVQVGCSEPVSKFELLETSARVFECQVRVHPTSSGRPLNRVLLPDMRRASIAVQLKSLRRWEGL